MSQSLAAASTSHNSHPIGGYISPQIVSADPYSLNECNGIISQSRHLTCVDLTANIDLTNGISNDNACISSVGNLTSTENHAGYVDINTHYMSHLNNRNHQNMHLQETATHTDSVLRSALSPSLDLHFAYRDNLNSSQFEAVPHSMSSCLGGFDTSSNATYMPSIYSPDSAAIVESSNTSGELYNTAKPSAPCPYIDAGNVTGYQHSYLYSLLQQQMNSPKAASLDLDDEIFGACAVEDVPKPSRSDANLASGSQSSSADEYLDVSSDCPKDFESDLEPIDFESEIGGLSATIIDKSLINSMASNQEEYTDDDDPGSCFEVVEAARLDALVNGQSQQLDTKTVDCDPLAFD